MLRTFLALVALITVAVDATTQPPTFTDQVHQVVRAWGDDADAMARLTVQIRHVHRYELWEGNRFSELRRTTRDTRHSPEGCGEKVLGEVVRDGKRELELGNIYLRNDSYFATLESRDGTAWRLKSIQLARDLRESDGLHDPWAPWPADVRLLWLAQQAGAVSWYRILQDPRARVTRVEATATGRRFHFVMQADQPPPAKTIALTTDALAFHTTIRGGWFEVSGPHRRLDSYELERSSPPSFKPYREVGTITYHEATGLPVPFAKRLEVETPSYTKRDGSVVRTRTVDEYEVKYPAGGSDDEYYLSYYGLPEPPGINPPARPTPTYVWLLIAAGILGVVALACRWLLKRRAKAVPPPPPATA